MNQTINEQINLVTTISLEIAKTIQTAINNNKPDDSKQVYKSIQLQNRQTTLNTIEKIAGINYKTPTLVAFGKLLYKIPSSYCDTSVDTLKRWKIKTMKMKN